jgi:hypothetical protein
LRRGASRGCAAPDLGGLKDTAMTTEQKIIRAKVGLLEIAKQLGNVSQACKMMDEPDMQISPASGSRTRLHAFAFACNAICSF